MNTLDELVKVLETYLVKKAPYTIPAKYKELIVKWSPWLAVVSLVLSLSALSAYFGFRSSMMNVFGAARFGLFDNLSILFLVVSMILMGLSIQGLFAKKKSGWNMAFYSILINTVYYLLTGDIFGLILGTLVSLYVIFQVKEYYK